MREGNQGFPFFYPKIIMNDSLVEMGTSFRVHGLKGAFSLYLYNPRSRVLKAGQTLFLRPKSKVSSLKMEGENYIVEAVAFGPKKCILYLKGVHGIDQAEKLLPFSVHLPRHVFPTLDANKKFYLVDLMGLTVVNAQGEGEVLGTVVNYFENGAQVVLKVDLVEGKSLELPFVHDFFPFVDLEAGRIQLSLPEFIEVAEYEEEKDDE